MSDLSMVVGQHQEIADWVAERQGVAPDAMNWGNFNTLSFLDDRGVKVALVYNGFHWPNVSIHVAAREGALWCKKDILFHIFSYPFVELRCRRITAPVDASNKRSRELVEHLGFVREGTLRKATRSGGDVCIYGMLAEECRWINKEDLKWAS